MKTPFRHAAVAACALAVLSPVRADDAWSVADASFETRVVKGAPYCADAVHETVKWLADPAGGPPNRIVRQQQTRLCRDGEGRTRQENEVQGRRVVYLTDPVAGESWVLYPATKSARRVGGRPPAGFDAGAWRDYGERMRDWARDVGARMATTPIPAVPSVPAVPALPSVPSLPAVPMPPQPPQPALVTRGEREVRIVRVDPAAPPLPPVPPLPELAPLAPRGPGVSTPLGTRDIDGVRAHGERTSWTIDAGKVGNERPIVIVRDVWTAPELMLTLATRDLDPRSAEVNYRLVNLRRGEPDPALMRVPADYDRTGAGRG